MAKIIAHRGASGYAPENTIAAFKIALNFGADSIELDVRPTKDQQVVVFHDKKLNRTTPINGLVKNMSLDELKNLDAGKWFDESHKNETIPDLDETIDFLKGKCEMLVEIKSEGKQVSGTFLKNLIDVIDRHQVKDQVILQSFHSKTLQNIAVVHPGYRLQKLIVLKVPFVKLQYDGTLMLENILKNPHYESINVDHRFVTPNFVRKIHRHNKTICCWTVNRPLRMFRLLNMGVDGIITNYPNRLKQIIERRNGLMK